MPLTSTLALCNNVQSVNVQSGNLLLHPHQSIHLSTPTSPPTSKSIHLSTPPLPLCALITTLECYAMRTYKDPPDRGTIL